jgi:DNA replication and repair protein RecF
MAVTYAAKDMPARECSTGEQKGLLISIVLAHALMMKAERGHAPLILLDEVAAHLDDARRAQLFTILREAGGQVWMTGTDLGIFASLRDAALFTIGDGQALRKRAS